MTQQDLAHEADVAVRSVQDAEGGKVPRARMPYTLPAIAAALGWPTGRVDQVLDDQDPSTGWRSVGVQAEIDADELESIITNAMVRATENATAAQIRDAARIAVAEMRKRGMIPPGDGPNSDAS